MTCIQFRCPVCGPRTQEAGTFGLDPLLADRAKGPRWWTVCQGCGRQVERRLEGEAGVHMWLTLLCAGAVVAERPELCEADVGVLRALLDDPEAMWAEVARCGQ